MPLPVLYERISRDALVEIAKSRTLSSPELLKLKSSTFDPLIWLLGIACGKNEFNKQVATRIMYNLLRRLDEDEDADSKKISTEQKIWCLERDVYTIGEVARLNQNADIDHIMNGNDLRAVTKMVSEAASDIYAKVFVEHFGRGEPLREFNSLDRNGKEAIDYCVKSMGSGMATFLRKGRPEKIGQTRDYCFQVAGVIGSRFFNRLIHNYDKDNAGNPITLDDTDAEHFGEFLQLINITKNVRLDYGEGRVFFPAELRPEGVSHEELMDDLGAAEARNNVFSSMTQIIQNDRDRTLDYLTSIPSQLSGFKAFCFSSYVTGIKTLEQMINSGAERVFAGDKAAITLQGGEESVYGIMNMSYDLTRNGKKTNEFLERFTSNPQNYNFEQKNYIKWSQEWLKAT